MIEAHLIAAIVIISAIWIVPPVIDSLSTDNTDIYPEDCGTIKTYQWRYMNSSSALSVIAHTDKINLTFYEQDYARSQIESMKLNAFYHKYTFESMKYLANDVMNLENPVISDLVEIFQNRTALMSELDKAAYVLSFVQSVPYVSDYDSTGKRDYWKSPCETLYRGGDCEDKSILYAKLMQELGYNVVLVSLCDTENHAGHMCTAVDIKEANGTYVEFNGKKYYCCETTSEGYTSYLALDSPVGNFTFGSYDYHLVIDISSDSEYRRDTLKMWDEFMFSR